MATRNLKRINEGGGTGRGRRRKWKKGEKSKRQEVT